MFGSILACNDLQTGFEIVTKNFNGLKEILTRKDAGSALLKKYKQLKPEDLGFYKFEYSKTVYVFIYLELLISQYQIIHKLTEKERIELLKESIRVLEEKLKFPDKYSLFEQKTSYLVMARLLKYAGLNFIGGNNKLEELDKFDQFIKYCIHQTIQFSLSGLLMKYMLLMTTGSGLPLIRGLYV